jgi:hypothetical protein
VRVVAVILALCACTRWCSVDSSSLPSDRRVLVVTASDAVELDSVSVDGGTLRGNRVRHWRIDGGGFSVYGGESPDAMAERLRWAPLPIAQREIELETRQVRLARARAFSPSRTTAAIVVLGVIATIVLAIGLGDGPGFPISK